MSLITSQPNNRLNSNLGLIYDCEESGELCAVLRVYRDGELVDIFVASLEYGKERGVEQLVGDQQGKGVRSLGLQEWSLVKLVEELKSSYGRDVVVFTEVIESRIRLVIMGAGHVGKSVAVMGLALGYDVLVIDDRAEFLLDEFLSDSGIKAVQCEFDRVDELGFVSRRTAVVIVTRGHQFDELCLRKVFEGETKPRYVGMIGSKRRVELVKKRLELDGVGGERVDRLRAPIGLRIGAVTPQEIAVAILAEIISEFRNDK